MRREELYVADLADNVRTIQEYLAGVSREQWDQDRLRRDAVLYRLLLLGEIASALPDDFRDNYPEVAWRQIRAFRNLAVHRYFGVDWAVVWKISQDEVPILASQVMVIMRAQFPELARNYESD
jgi:uncharacterized protein with HEPN domain